jgi:hypothetical protein
MYGRLAEVHNATEVNWRFLYDLVLKLKSGEVKIEQVEELPDTGFKVNPVENGEE